MSFVSYDRKQVAAKTYRCYFCDGIIERGEPYGRRAGATDGDFWEMKFHLECNEEARAKEWDFEEDEPGTMNRPWSAYEI